MNALTVLSLKLCKKFVKLSKKCLFATTIIIAHTGSAETMGQELVTLKLNFYGNIEKSFNVVLGSVLVQMKGRFGRKRSVRDNGKPRQDPVPNHAISKEEPVKMNLNRQTTRLISKDIGA